MNAGEPGAGLARAARLYAQRCAESEPEPVAAFLSRHEELREWLEPMLTEGELGDGGAPPPGHTRLGPFWLLRELGRGGMGVVHEARAGDDPTPIAIKLLPDFLALRDDRSARFHREAEMARRLDHEGIVRVLDAGSVGGTQYLAMEFVVGAPLDRVLAALGKQRPHELTGTDLEAAVRGTLHVPTGASGPPPPTDAFSGSYVACVVRLAIQLAEALAHAHTAGVIHRDVKPSNLLVRTDGRVVLTDFGLARAAAGSTLTMTGDFAGTAHYVSPEQAMAKRVHVDHRTDLFSLGSTLYELLTLHRAFDGDTAQEVLGRILSKEPPSATNFHPGLPEDLVTVLGKLLEKDPDRRYRDARELATDLGAFLEFRPVAARRASTFTRMLRWTRREPWRASLVLVLAVAIPALAGGAGYLLARADEIRAGRDQLRTTRITAHVDDGFLDFALGDPATALAHFEAALQLDPGCAEAQVGLMQTVLARDGPEMALQRVERDLVPHAPPGFADLLRFPLLHRMQRPEASAVLARVPAPRTESELFLQAMINRDSGEHTGTDVLELIERAVLAGERPRLWVHLHWAIFADAASDAGSCRRCAANLRLNWPTSPVASYFACVALRHAEPAQALQLARAAVAAAPESGVLHCALGMVLSARGDQADARQQFELAIARMPGVPRFHYALGKVCFEAGDLDDAIAAMQVARDLSPRLVEASIGLGMALRRAGRADEALEALAHAAALHPSNADARFQYGQMLVQAGQVDQGLGELHAAARLNAADPNKWHHVASALFATGDEPGGLAALHRAVAAKPDYERAHAMLVMYLQQRATHDEVRAAMLAWVEALPQSLDAWLRLGLDAVGDPLPGHERDAATALWAARRALAISEERSAMAWLVLAEAQAMLGQGGAAAHSFERSLDTKGMPLSLADRSRAEQRLRELRAGGLPETRK